MVDVARRTWKVPSPLPSSTLTSWPVGGREVELAVAVEVADREGAAGRRRWRRSEAGWNVPSPLPSSTLTVLFAGVGPRPGRARPSLLKSAGNHCLRVLADGVAHGAG